MTKERIVLEATMMNYMKKRMTGGSELSRKLLTVILLSVWATSYGADNSIYIDQAGDFSTVTITQDGSGNRVKGILSTGVAGGTTDPAKFNGNSQDITVNQKGATNVLAIGATTTVGGTANKGITINYDVSDGSGGNTAKINSNNNGTGVSSGNLIDIKQFGGSATADINMLGINNQLIVDQQGGANNVINAIINAGDVYANINQSGGGGNETTLNLTGDKGQVLVTTVGATNITNITQSGGSVNGQYAKLDITGSGNTTTITQTGLFDNQADIKLNSGSNGNTITLAQSGGSSSGQNFKLDLTGSTNIINTTQQGSVDNWTNMKITGSSNTYNILQKN